MFLQIFAPLIGTIGLYLQLPFVLVAILLALISFQRIIRNEFAKSLFHGYVFLLIFLASVLAIIHIRSLDVFVFSHFDIIYIYWSVLIFLLPVSIVLFFIRKIKSKKYRLVGYAIAVIVFATVFLICHYTILQEIGLEGFPPAY